MAKLYPPVIAGTIPAFCGTSIEVPFSMNRAVGISEFNGFMLKIKKVSGTLVGTIPVMGSSMWLERHSVTFTLPEMVAQELKVGEFYKVQLAYAKLERDTETKELKARAVGIYSTIGVTKYISMPSVTIENLNPNVINNHSYSYSGVYRQIYLDGQDNEIVGDTTEKLYSSRFVIYDTDGNIVKDSGEILHNTTHDTSSWEASDEYMIPEDLELNKIYYLYYIATTVNGYVKESPRYRITQRRQIPMNLQATIKATVDTDAGCVKIDLISDYLNQVASGQFLLSRRADSDVNEWEEMFYFTLQSEIPDRLLFTDYTVAQGVKYTYSLQQYNSNNVYSDRELSNSVTADFEDLFLYDGKRQLKVKFNPKVATFKTNVVESKTNTLGSKYPFITRNGHVDYKEMTVSGLVSYKMDDIRSFFTLEELGLEYETHNLVTENIKAERDFKLAVMNWLNDGQPKLFRSPTEGNYIVRLMNVTMSPTDTLGRMLHTFNCSAYEIDDYNYDNLSKYGLIDVVNDIQYQMRWHTIQLSKYNTDTNQVEYFTGQVNQGNNYGEIATRPVYHIEVTEMMPGTYFLIGESKETAKKVYIGTTGAYEISVSEPYLYVGIPETDEFGNPVEWEGLITYGYKSQVTSLFDLITNVEINDVPCYRIIGYTGDSVLSQLEDIKTTILAIKYVRFSVRGHYPIYVMNDFDEKNPESWNRFNMFGDKNVTAYYSTYAKDPAQVVSVDDPLDPEALDVWNLYKVLRRREDYNKYEVIAGEGYYVDRHGNYFTPDTGLWFDPVTQSFYPDEDVFTISVNDELMDLSETEQFVVTGIDYYKTLKAGVGIVTDIGYQTQTSTYSFETTNLEIQGLKSAYLTELNKYLKNRGTTGASVEPVKAAYVVFINRLTEVVNRYKEENEIA